MLEPLFAERFKKLETLPKDATVQIVAGKPKVIPAVDGMVVARDKVVPAILAILPKPSRPADRRGRPGAHQGRASPPRRPPRSGSRR